MNWKATLKRNFGVCRASLLRISVLGGRIAVGKQGVAIGCAYSVVAGLVLSTVMPVAAEVNVFPKSISLNHQRDFQQVIVQHTDGYGVTTDITSEAKIVPPAIVQSRGTVIRPAADGEANITIQVRGAEIALPVSVQNATLDPPVSFQREVIPALTKTGCNSDAATDRLAVRTASSFLFSVTIPWEITND